MRAIFGLLLICTTLLALPARAGDGQVVVVELFTSQGCSSCPPADKLLAALAGRDDVLALALHVDYWDYIGWADSFARPEHTVRQKAYAHAAGESSIYTPQMIIGGVDHIAGFKPMEVADYISMHRDQLGAVAMTLSRTGERLALRAEPVEGTTLPGPVEAFLVRFIPMQTITIAHGENAGEVITYANIVTEMEPLGRWDGQGVFELTAPVAGGDKAAVILQRPGPGPVLAAMKLR